VRGTITAVQHCSHSSFIASLGSHMSHCHTITAVQHCSPSSFIASLGSHLPHCHTITAVQHCSPSSFIASLGPHLSLCRTMHTLFAAFAMCSGQPIAPQFARNSHSLSLSSLLVHVRTCLATRSWSDGAKKDVSKASDGGVFKEMLRKADKDAWKHPNVISQQSVNLSSVLALHWLAFGARALSHPIPSIHHHHNHHHHHRRRHHHHHHHHQPPPTTTTATTTTNIIIITPATTTITTITTRHTTTTHRRSSSPPPPPPAQLMAKVECHVKLKLRDGPMVLDTTAEGKSPLSFIVGDHDAIRGIEDAVQSMAAGEIAKFEISPSCVSTL
jgi:FKBP-type peptidyl-prolyl cis-trans isomerase